MVSLTDVSFYSLCPHHFLPFFGRAHVAYIPRERIAGLGELARVVDLFARKPQLQEQLCEEVVECLERELQPAGAMVVLQARHLCMEMRGVHKSGALAITSAVRGDFEDRVVRDEFLRRVPDAPH
jgi:GTP cyclohydrolase I